MASTPRTEARALLLSMFGSGGVGLAGVAAGVVTGADVVLFDGMVTLAGILLVLVSVIASRVAASSPTTEFPYGRHAATPLAVAVQGAALLGALAYGSGSAAATMAAGGTDPAGTVVAVYGAMATIVSLAMTAVLSHYAKASPLARAELVSWRAGACLSGVVTAGGVAGIVLTSRGMATAAGYLDPALVLVASMALLPTALGLVRDGGRELLEAAPPPHIADAVSATARRVQDRFSLPAPLVRATKLGRRLYVDVGFAITDRDWDITDEDEVRTDIHAELSALDYDVVASVIITLDRRLLG